MMDSLRDLLAAQPLVLIFLAIGAGFLLGHIKLLGAELGVAAVLFVGLGLGAWGDGHFVVPEFAMQFGLLLFVYMIGLQSGPAFLRLLRKRGLALGALAFAAVGASMGVTWLVATITGLPAALAAGLLCGATTNTPALAAVTDVLKGTADAQAPTIGYSLAYPIGVLVPLLLAEGMLRLRHVDVAVEAKRAEEALGMTTEPPQSKNLRVENPGVNDVLIGSIPFEALGLRVSRVQRGESVVVAEPETRLALGDVLHVVGSHEALAQAQQLVGRPVPGPGPEAHREQVDFRRMTLSSSALLGKTLGQLELEHRFGATVTRVRRGDRDFVPTAATVLERGDRLRVVGPPGHLPQVATYLGDSDRALGEMDFLSLSLGMLIGIALGSIHFPLPGTGGFTLGMAGGTLLVALALGAMGHTGRITWQIPAIASIAIRQLGLVLFFAAVGLRAGGHFPSAFASYGYVLLISAVLVAATSTAVLLIGARRVLHADWATTTGVLAGGQTQPALLAFAGDRMHTEAPNDSYVAILPAAMIAKIAAAQALLMLVGP